MRRETSTRRWVSRQRPAGQPRMRTNRLVLTAVVAVAVVVAGAVWLRQAVSDSGPPTALTHVHGLGINPADGALYVATHDGLYRLPATGGPPQLVGSGRQDTMGFTIAGPDHFLASGHPAPGQDGPPHLGLIESTDAGTTWTTRSLAGQADFHALRFRHDTVYGYNSVTGQLIVSTDKTTWQTRTTMPIRDIDVHPADAQTLLATTETGLHRSGDGGATWNPQPRSTGAAPARLGYHRPAVGRHDHRRGPTLRRRRHHLDRHRPAHGPGHRVHRRQRHPLRRHRRTGHPP